MISIAQISDLHVYPADQQDRPYNTNASLQQTIRHLNARTRQPDMVLVTGDLANKGLAAEYEAARDILADLETPYYVIPGNHDDRETLRGAFHDHTYMTSSDAFIQYTIDHLPLRLIGLDTVIPGSDEGMLCQERLDWLDDTLAGDPERPTLVFMHHPLLFSRLADAPPTSTKGKSFEEVIAGHQQVDRIICGHIHRAITREFAGTFVTLAPSTCYGFAYSREKQKTFTDHSEPPGYLIHHWSTETGVTTQSVVLPEAGAAGRSA